MVSTQSQRKTCQRGRSICPRQDNVVLVKAGLQEKATQAENKPPWHCSSEAAKPFGLKTSGRRQTGLCHVPGRAAKGRAGGCSCPSTAQSSGCRRHSSHSRSQGRDPPSATRGDLWSVLKASNPAWDAGMGCCPPGTPRPPATGSVARERLIRHLHPGPPEPPPLPRLRVMGGGMRGCHSP